MFLKQPEVRATLIDSVGPALGLAVIHQGSKRNVRRSELGCPIGGSSRTPKRTAIARVRKHSTLSPGPFSSEHLLPLLRNKLLGRDICVPASITKGETRVSISHGVENNHHPPQQKRGMNWLFPLGLAPFICFPPTTRNDDCEWRSRGRRFRSPALRFATRFP